MRVELFSDLERLQNHAVAINCIARHVPFRRWEWMSAWWRSFGAKGELFALGVFDGDRLVGLAPWWMERRSRGNVIRFLGDGDACSDYMTILSTAEHEDRVPEAIGCWLLTTQPGETPVWDLLELEGVCESDRVAPSLAAYLLENGAAVHRREHARSWRIDCPDTWEQFLSVLSKSHRRQLRKLERETLQSERAAVHTAANEQEFERGWELLVDLHQRRRRSLGEPGCFACERFTRFLHDASLALFREGCLELHWLSLDDRPAAAEIHFLGDDVAYAYQSGVEVDLLDQSPGRLLNIALIRDGISRGRRGMDFLRGDEPYKSHWRATPRPLLEYRIAPPRLTPQIRHGMWLAGDTMKGWIKSGMQLTGMRSLF